MRLSTLHLLEIRTHEIFLASPSHSHSHLPTMHTATLTALRLCKALGWLSDPLLILCVLQGTYAVIAIDSQSLHHIYILVTGTAL